MVKPGDTVWGYWKEHGKGTEWQSYKTEFNKANTAILADGWLNPKEIAVLPQLPAAPAPKPAPQVVGSQPRPAGASANGEHSGGPQAAQPAPTAKPNTGNNPGNPAAPGWHPPMALPKVPTTPAPNQIFLPIITGAPANAAPPNTGNNPGNPAAPGWHPPMALPKGPTTPAPNQIFLPIITGAPANAAPPNTGNNPGNPAAPGWHPPMAPQGNTTATTVPGLTFLPIITTPPAAASPPAATIPPPFSVGPATVAQQGAVSGTSMLNAGQRLLNDVLPGSLSPDLGFMFGSDRGQQAALKLFTPNKDFIKGARGEYSAGGASIKIHGWVAERNEVALSPSWITADGTKMRTGTITMSLGAQLEGIGEAQFPQGDIRALVTLNGAENISYSITTNEARLKDIMTGKAPAPNPLTLENMKAGDSVTISTGPSVTGEAELRLLLGKSASRAGLDVKFDKWSAESKKFTVKMVENPDPAKKNEPHVLILDGDRQGNGTAVGFGLIWNPKLFGANKDGTFKGRFDPYANGSFGRVLLQTKESTEQESYNFVELNPFDTSKGGGRELYQSVISTGVVSYNPTTNTIPGALALGTMSVDAKNASASLQLTGYFEPKHPAGHNRAQVLGQYTLDLMTMIDQQSRTKVISGGPNASVGNTGDMNVAARYTDGGFTNYFHNYKVDAKQQVSKEKFVLTAESVSKDQLIDALKGGDIATIRLHTKDGQTLTGQDAVNWMRHNEDGWFGGNDKVGVVVDMGKKADADAFSKQFIADQKKYHDDQKDGFINTALYWLGQSQMSSPEVAIASLAAPDVFASPDQIGNLNDHQKAQNADENFKVMSGSGMGNLLQSMSQYWQHAGHATAYPVTVDIFVDWQP